MSGTERKRQIVFLVLTVLFQGWVLGKLLWETRGMLYYPEWKDIEKVVFVEGKEVIKKISYYHTEAYSAIGLLLIAYLLVILFEIGLIWYGIHKKNPMGTIAAGIGNLLFLGFLTQAFYKGGGSLKKQMVFAVGGIAILPLMYWILHRKMDTKIRVWSQWTLAIALGGNLLMILVNYILGNDVHGSYAWVEIGGISIQPGEFLKVLLVIYSAACYRERQERKIGIVHFILSMAAVGELVLSRDLGNALVVAVIWLVSFWYLFDRWLDTILIGMGGVSIFTLLCMETRYVRSRFAGTFVALQNGIHADSTSQIYKMLRAVLTGGAGGLGYGKEAVTATSVPSGETDFVFEVGLAIFGVGFGILVVFCIGILLAQIFAPVLSPSFHMLLILSGAAIFTETILHIGGGLNVLPLTGICLPWMSSGGSSMVSNMMFLGCIIAALCPAVNEEQHRRKWRRKRV